MKIDASKPVKLECTMPNGSIVWLSYEQWQHSPAAWTGGIVGHRESAATIVEVLRQSDLLQNLAESCNKVNHEER